MLLYYSLAAFLALVDSGNAQSSSAAPAAAAAAPSGSGAPATGSYPTDLVGTWSSKSRSVLTGPGFYDPLNDNLLEPDHTGISYSFTSDGYFEEAYYRANANPTAPDCPSAIMQWQHGSWTFNADGSLKLEPLAVDGRQLTSQPCNSDNSIYLRYNQTETFERYSVYTDPFHNIPRLDLFQFDGSPLMPLYLIYSPPQMLPTTTLNPIVSATAASNKKRSEGEGSKHEKRGGDFANEVPINWKSKLEARPEGVGMVKAINAEKLWWVGLGMTGLGGLLYLGPRRMGIQI
ncbi:Reversal of tor2 lethality [Saxophila tyrrhenica]|uniref:Protein ROT1 n=1 Tax=Saxophila tyrrhenica TaxID=1690608 RepID=A0AAV9NUE9_9PEZI|nr:Reversal of tor2 lethality [Saxophila tyrrhenica]